MEIIIHGKRYFILETMLKETIVRGYMNRDERDEFLTILIGECWHDSLGEQYDYNDCCSYSVCSKCGDNSYNRIRFSTWQGFGKLVIFMNAKYLPWMIENMKLALLDPDKFATQVYNYLTSETLT